MKRFKNILFVVDETCRQDTALRRALTLAGHNQADLTMVMALDLPRRGGEGGDSLYARLRDALVRDRQQQLDTMIRELETDVPVRGKIIEERVFPGIVREVLRGGHDLVMKCAEEGGGFHARLFGGTDMHLLRKCPCPVWIMQDDGRDRYERIVAAVDVADAEEADTITALNRQILEMASSLALSESGDLHIVHAWTAWGESLLNTPRFSFAGDSEVAGWVERQKQEHEIKVRELMKELTASLGSDTLDFLKPDIHIIKGEAHKVIPQLVRDVDADLVVMGTVARTGIPGFIMGNTAESILRSIGCSVLAVKPTGFVTPVTLE
ncbi:universal stress protein [Thermodesulfobacteriota bacterium B35]